MIKSSIYANLVFKHSKECNYCYNHSIKKYDEFSFSTLDGFTNELQYKLDRLKRRK